MLFRDLPGILNGVECKSEYKLIPFLLHGFLFQEKRIQTYPVFLKDMSGNIFLIGIGRVFKDGLFHKKSMNILTNYNSYMMIPVT